MSAGPPAVAEIVAAASADDDTYEAYLARAGTSPRGLVSLAEVARRTRAGEDFFFCVREHLATARLLSSHERHVLVDERPADLDDPVAQAYLGALAEHACAAADQPAPGWALAPDRFLDWIWFGTDTPGFEPWCLVESPAAFRRRGLFVTRGRLERV